MPNRRELGYVSAGSVSTIPATTGYGVATGGSSSSITVSGQNYTLLTFTSDGTLTVTSAGLFDVFLWSGGGGGGGGSNTGSNYGSGGGAGGRYVLVNGFYLDANQSITIGAGGAGGVGRSHGAVGAVTTLGTLLSTFRAGGGESLGSLTAPNVLPFPSGGAVAIGNGGYVAGVGTAFGGYSGGNGASNAGGGGGGATAAGSAGSGNTGGAGGAGYDVSSFIGGSALYKGAGGGGGAPTTGGAGGSSVGGAGASGAGNGGTAAANTASGGGGASETGAAGNGGAGGSGIVYVRFKV